MILLIFGGRVDDYADRPKQLSEDEEEGSCILVEERSGLDDKNGKFGDLPMR